MNTPPLRFPEFTGEWEKKKLGEMTDIYDGTHQTPTYVQQGIPFYSVEQLTANDFNKTKFVTQEVFEKENKRVKLEKGDILMTRIGDIGTSRYIDWDVNASFYVSIVLIKQSSKFNSKFVHHFIGTRFFQNELWNRTIHVAFPKKINLGEIGNCLIQLSRLEEQTKIATFLTAVDEKIQALKKKHSLLEQYKKGVMQKLFSQELRFRDEHGNEFPEWEVMNGGGLFESISNKKHNSDLPILAISQEFGAIPREMINYQISVTDRSVESYKVVDVGDFIISLRSFQGGIEYSNYKGICSPAYVILRNTSPINNNFFKYYFKTDLYIQRLCEKLEGIRDGKMISYKYFSEIELPYPSVVEQTKIANFLSAIDEKLNHTNVQITLTETWKKGLLQKMFC